MPLRVVYINHYGAFGGAQRSLLELVRNFPSGEIEAFVITPTGRMTEVLEKAGIAFGTVRGISKLDHTRIGYYRGWRWLILIREFFYLLPTFTGIIRYRRYFKHADIIHINENTCIIPLLLCKWLYKKKTVLHARAVMNNNPSLWRTRYIGKLFRKYADAIIAIDENVHASLPAHQNIFVIHNGFAINEGNNVADPALFDKLQQIPKRKLNLGFVGVLDRNKGIFELLEAVKRCIDRGMDINLLLLGNFMESGKGILNRLGIRKRKTTGDDPVVATIRQLQLEQDVYVLGFSTDLPAFYQWIDVICFPSYYDAPGRPVFEGAFFGKPSILAVSKPQPDTFIENVTGLSVTPRDVLSLVTAIEFYYCHGDAIKTLGTNACELAKKNFDSRTNACSVAEIYRKLDEMQ